MSVINRSIRLLLAACAAALLRAPTSALAQGTGTVSGVVADSAGAAITGARVSVDGASIATSSGRNGRYTLSNLTAGSHSIRAQLLGYSAQTQTATIAAGQTATVNFRLVRAAAELERIVVSTGYGQTSKVNTTGANDVVAGEEITKRPVSNISKGLQGTVPGLTIQDFGGRPGSDAAQVRIRGGGSLGDNGALIIVDGVVGELNNLDPLDIESVSVLKDAASAAIYGARAANGVVIVKTRRGRNTGGLKLTYDGYVASQKAVDMPERVDIRTELNTVNRVYTDNGQAAKYSAGYIDSTALGLDPINYPNTNWLSLIYKTSPMSDQTVRLSGGNDLAQLSVSGNYFDQQGILAAETYYKRYNLRANSNFNISKRLTALANVNLMDEKSVWQRGEGDAQFRAYHDTPPTSLAFYPDGSYSWSKSSFNPVELLREQGNFRARWLTTTLNTQAAYALENGFRFTGQFEADNKDFRRLEFQPTYTFYDEVTSPTVPKQQNVRTLSIDSRNTDFNFDAQMLAEYEKTFGAHAFHLLGGYEQRQSTSDGAFAQRQGAYNNDLQLPGSGDASLQNTGSGASQVRIVRQFARVNYDLLGRYLFEADLSHDGSSRFGPNSKYGTFPSFSAAWRVSQEDFFKNHVGFINEMKLRGSWGRLGNDRIGDYLFQQTININSGNYTFNNALATGATPGRIANPDISWETTEQTDLGTDLEMFGGKLSFTGDVYKKQTTGILLQLPISSLVGQTAPTSNSGGLQNKGWETAVNWRSNVGTFTYSLGFNLADNRAKITSLPSGDQFNVTTPNGGGCFPCIRRLGEEPDSYFGIKAVGIFQTQAEINAWAKQSPKTAPGDLKYQDTNNDGKIDANDRVIIGSNVPHYLYGAPMSASYKNFDVSVLWQGVGHRDAFLDGALIEGPTWENFFPTYLLDSWTPENPNAKWPRFAFRSDHNQNAPGSNSWYIRDAKYLSLKNLNVGYTLPTSLVGRAGVSSARVYVAGTNVYTWTGLRGLTPPEFNPQSDRATYYFQTRNWNIGTSVGF